MKKLAIFTAILSVSQLATAASLICYDRSSPYQVTLSDHWDTATVQSNGMTLPFGNLACVDSGNGGTLLASCTSAGSVRDAGFVTYFNFANGGRSIEASLYQMSFAGLRQVAVLPCDW